MSIEAIVIGSGINALGVVRSLGKQNVKVGLYAKNKGPAAQSRYVSDLHINDQLVDAQSVASAFSYETKPVIFFTEEEDVKSALQNSDKWLSLFNVALCETSLGLQLLDKEGFDQLARQHQAPVPEVYFIEPGGVLGVDFALRFPCALKPLERNAEYSKTFSKAYKVSNLTELTDLVNQIRPVNVGLIVQEWIEGEDKDIYFTLAYRSCSGEIKTSFSGRKVYSWPPKVGGTASCTSAFDEHEHLLSLTQDFLDKTNYAGLLGMEFKKDSRNGQFYMVEPTVVRTDYQHEIATLSGVNLIYSIYCDLANISDSAHQGPQRREDSANNTVKQPYWFDVPEESYAKQSAGLTSTEDSVPFKRYSAYFRWDDPMPELYRFYEYQLKRIKMKLAGLSSK